jgi:predicted dehydrogenase
MINAGVIGYGYWGPNIVRNFNSNPNINLSIICDKSDDRLKVVKQIFPDMKITNAYDDIINSSEIDLVAIVTPVKTHYDLAKQALLNGKHIFIEKPFTLFTYQAEELIEIADRKGLVIMVDHTFLFTGAVKKMKELIDSKTLGNLYYYDSIRVNLGLFQHDVNVLWDLAPHDISILNHLIEDLKPISLNAVGSDHFNKGLEDVAYLNIQFENNFIANFHVNWLSPVKIRHVLIAGDKKMMVWNDLHNDEKIKIYDSGVAITNQTGIYDLLVQYRTGDMFAPKIIDTEALEEEVSHLVNCILEGKTPMNDGISGLKVVKILEAAESSIKSNGKYIKL